MQAYTVNDNGDVVVIENFVDVITVFTPETQIFSTTVDSNVVDVAYGITNVTAIEKIDDALLGGGFRVKTTIAERDAIPPTLRKQGMRVSVLEDSTTYALVNGIANTDWVAYPDGILGSAYSVIVDVGSTVEIMRLPLASFQSLIAVVNIIDTNIVESFQSFVHSLDTVVSYNKTNILGSQNDVQVSFDVDILDMVVNVDNTSTTTSYQVNLRYL